MSPCCVDRQSLSPLRALSGLEELRLEVDCSEESADEPLLIFKDMSRLRSLEISAGGYTVADLVQLTAVQGD